MQNPFARPQTTYQWLLGSMCWTLVCVGSWLSSSYALTRWPEKAEFNILYFPFGFCLANLLVARYALLNGWRFVSYREASRPLWLTVAASTWFGVLASFQLVCLAAFCVVLYWLFLNT